MKVGTDAVLLGSWADIENDDLIVDVGTGCGIIALMLAQRNDIAQVVGVDIHPESIIEAESNFRASNWSHRLRTELISFQELDFSPDLKSGHIVCNPPFFMNSTPAPLKERHLARHMDSLTPKDFFTHGKRLLSLTGKISIIIPALNHEVWIHSSQSVNMYPSRILQVFSYPGKAMERILIEFKQFPQKILTNVLYIRNGKNLGYSDAYKALTNDFYL